MAKVIYLKDIGSENLEGLLDEYTKHLKETDRAGSIRIYLGDIKAFVAWFTNRADRFNPQAVTPLDIVDYRDYLKQLPGRKGGCMAPVTINRKLVSLRVFFDWLHGQKVIFDNPVTGIKPIGTQDVPEVKWLARNEQSNLVRVVRDRGSSRDYALIVTLLHTGLRVNELCNLNREDISISPRKGYIYVRGGKGNRDRKVPLNRTVRGVLEKWLTENPTGQLWPNRYGKPISTRGVYKLVTKYAYMAKIERDVSPHTLRHTFGKNLVDRGEPLEKVAALMGHVDMNITRIYTMPSQEDLQLSVEKIAWE